MLTGNATLKYDVWWEINLHKLNQALLCGGYLLVFNNYQP